MAKMLADAAHTDGHIRTCLYGAKCCTTDGRKTKQIRRTSRRREKQAWKNAL